MLTGKPTENYQALRIPLLGSFVLQSCYSYCLYRLPFRRVCSQFNLLQPSKASAELQINRVRPGSREGMKGSCVTPKHMCFVLIYGMSTGFSKAFSTNCLARDWIQNGTQGCVFFKPIFQPTGVWIPRLSFHLMGEDLYSSSTWKFQKGTETGLWTFYR